ncbi:beta-beta-alpha zinc fingers domain-containing protein [Dioscorea alata]|nr:beta-beta-alpha zinc fingers domain-containing protein [Dioscorea alata]
MMKNRFVCEICNKGFQRDQNLQLHRRGHNLPWKLKQRTNIETRKRVYICPEVTCVHHDPSRALGDLTGIKKHFFRKHGEKKWKCEKCLKKYAVQSDWKAHSKTCGTREYKCDCGTIFSRRDSFVTHRAFCDALEEDNIRVDEGLRDSKTRNFKGENPQLIMPVSGNNTSMIKSSFAQDFIPMPIKSMRMADVGMFSSNSGPVFGLRSIPLTPASLQLSHDSPGGSSAHMLHKDLVWKLAKEARGGAHDRLKGNTVPDLRILLGIEWNHQYE